MSVKILGLDLGTNSIGWAIRDTDSSLDNQIINYGVTVFRKGVGDGKSGEFSLAAERRKNRSKRRLYNAKRYRKWELLKVLIDYKMCPLKVEELRLWSIGSWQNGKNTGRQYPIENHEWIQWLALDPTYFGDNGQSENGKKIRKSPYILRSELIEKFEEDEQKRKYKIGRALYHLVQRRGFKTNRKSGKSSYGESELLKKFFDKYPDKTHWKSSQIFTFLQSDECAETELKLNRIRKDTGVLQRKYYEEEFDSICEKQKVSEELKSMLKKAIYFVRPLRTQKGLVGKCTLEKGKPRIPISHPAFEESRALQFINNLQWRETVSSKPFEPIPMKLKKDIFQNLFFRKIQSGKNKGKVSTDGFFKFDDIIEQYSENGKYEFNFKNKPNVSTCPVISGLMNLFTNEWKIKFIIDENRFGINWSGLYLEYAVKYGKKKGETRKLTYEEIWHLLFDFLQTRDKEEELKQFCIEVLGWTEERASELVDIDIQQGYGSLSRSAIVNILPYLQEGYIYSEAVSFANLSKVLGKEKFFPNKEVIKQSIADTIKRIDKEKELLNIVNSLIQKYFGDIEEIKEKRLDEKIKSGADIEANNKLKSYFGIDNWNEKPDKEQKEYFDSVFKKYLVFLDGKQLVNEKAASLQGKNPERDYYKLPRLDEAIKEVLKEKFYATETGLKHLYHPSDIEIYPRASFKKIVDKESGEIKEIPKLGDPQPPSKGFKNPMAMRTMYELKKLVQYLLDVGKIDSETKIVIEIARELNDKNKRLAIQTYQRRREEENKEFAKAILGVAKLKYPELNENDAENIDKVRLWWEQLPNGEEIYKQVKELKDDVQKYRLWKEQECQCIYTGKLINLTDLFDGTKTQFAHTFQRSESFDNSLANLTVSDAYYNMNIQQNQIPALLNNYDKEWKDPKTGKVYTPIKPRLKKWIDKRDSLKERIENNRVETKKAKARGDIERKNELIKFRRMLEIDFDYWNKKVQTFTLKEIPKWWKNSQIVDTQIVTKYARAYLKSLFHRVEVQKAKQNSNDSQDGMVNIFKKIYKIKGDEQKDRTRHSHHAIDAAVLTLIPGSARREEILRRHYESLDKKDLGETNKVYHEKPYPTFDIKHVSSIVENILINHVSRDRTLIPTYKKIRKRGNVQLTQDGKEMVMRGDSIRGQLHKETFFGTIKVPDRNKDGYAIKKDGRYLARKNKKTGDEEIWLVVRKPTTGQDKIKEADLDKIIDPILRKHIREQLNQGIKWEDVADFNGKKIRHVRCKVALPSYEKSLKIKTHSHLSKKIHKQYYRTDNVENYLCIYYEGVDEKERSAYAFRFVNLFEFANLQNRNILGDPDYSKYIKVARNKEMVLSHKHIFKVGDLVMLFKESSDEIDKNDPPIEHVFRIYKFNNSGADYIFLQNVIEARSNDELGDGETLFYPDKYQARLKLTAANFKCLIEGKDFEIKPDGEIMWID